MDFSMEKHTEAVFEKTFAHSELMDAGLEAVVPDTMPDIARIVFVDGTVIIREKEAVTGGVTVSAGVAVTVLYIPEEGGGPRKLRFALPVSLTLDAPGVTPDSVPVAMLTLASLDARILNPRKLILRAGVAASLSCWDRAELTFYERRAELPGVETLCESCTLSPVVLVKEKTFTVMDEYAMPPGKPPVGEVLETRSEILCGEVRSVGSKLVLKATARVTAVYLAAESGEVCSVSFESPFSQLIETDMELTAPDCAAHVMLTAEYIDDTGSGDAISGFTAELHAVAQVVCRDSRSAGYVSDCYSNSAGVEMETVCPEVEAVAGKRGVRETLQGEIGLPANAKAVNVCLCRLGEAAVTGGKLKLPVSAECLCTDESGQLFRATGKFTLESELDGEADYLVTAQRGGEAAALPGNRTLELRLPVEAELMAISRRSVEQISLIRTSPLESAPALPSVKAVRAREGDTLWLLGKKHHSTGVMIAELNSLESEELESGRILLIPCAK